VNNRNTPFLVMSVVPTEGLSLLNPFNDERLTACSYFQPPLLHWETIGTYKAMRSSSLE